MVDEFDPRLSALLEEVDAGRADSSASIDVIVALEHPLDPSTREDLVDRGFGIRSEIGDIVTGSIALGDVRRLARSTHVKALEGGSQLFVEIAPEDTKSDDNVGTDELPFG